MVQYSFFIAVVLFLCCSVSSQDFFPDYEDEYPLPRQHERIRRFVRFMSRKPGLDSEVEKGIGFKGHLVNLLKGGTLGMEFYIPHIYRLKKHVPYWNELLGNNGNKDEGKARKDEEDEEEEFGDKEADGEEDVELADEGEDEIETPKREENELDYVHVIDPRIRDNEP